MISESLGALRALPMTDILVTGFVEKEAGLAHFHPLYRIIYFEFDAKLLKLSVVDYSGRLECGLADRVTCDADLDEGMDPAVTSIAQMVLRDPDGSNLLQQVSGWLVDSSQCVALRFDLANGQRIFVDPSFHFGFRVGGQEQEDHWRDNWTGPPCEIVQFLAPSGPDPGPR